jgi:hypothetical protein
MKRLFALFLFTLVSLNLKAQNYNNVKQVEFEIGLGFITGHSYDGSSANIGGGFFLETRLNVINTPFDVGLQVMAPSFDRDENRYGKEQKIDNPGILVTFVDYNFRKWKNTAAFVGLGIGRAPVDITDTWRDTETGKVKSISDYNDRSFVFNPRMGIEVYNHFRITAEYKLMNYRAYSFIGINAGIVLGGGCRK